MNGTGAVRTRSRDWADEGTRLLETGLGRLSGADLDGPSALPGWSRRYLLAHVASNAEAIGRLLTWARTGVETPMYTSPEQRTIDIERGATRADLTGWVRSSAAGLARAWDAMPPQAWRAEVVTAQGRTVPASETLWMRARETLIHAVDLGAGVTFGDLPPDFLIALLDDVAAWRSARPGPAVELVTPVSRHEIAGAGDPVTVELPPAAAAAWLVGRPVADPAADLPDLPRWL